MKDVTQTLVDFLAQEGLDVRSIELKTNSKGQVATAGGTFTKVPFDIVDDGNKIAKAYRKKLVPNDYRFHNTMIAFNEFQGKLVFGIS